MCALFRNQSITGEPIFVETKIQTEPIISPKVQIGCLQGTFLLFGGDNILKMGYGAYKSEHDDKKVARTALASRLLAKIRPRGFHPPIAFPDDYQGYDQFFLWENPNPPS